MAKKLLLISLILFVGFNSKAQKTKKRDLVKVAENQILGLKNGVLLVRLQSSSNSILALKKRSHNQAAARIEAEQKAENKAIIAAFKEYFPFCKVYFFMADSSEKISNREFENLFVNQNLKLDTSIHLPKETFFLIAEYCKLESEINYIPDSVNAANIYGTEMSFPVLSLKDENLNQLKRPFPFYTKTTILGQRKSKKQSVKDLNKKLTKYYEFVTNPYYKNGKIRREFK